MNVTRLAVPALVGLLALFPAVSASSTAEYDAAATAELFEALGSLFADREDVEPILARGADPNGVNEHGLPVLSLAANMGHEEVLEVLLAAGAKIDAPRSRDGATPLMLAILGDEQDAVRILVQAGADLEIADNDGWTVVHWAAHGDALHSFRVLQEKKPALDVLDNEGWSPLNMAVARSSRNMIDALLESGAKWTDPVGGIPILHRAAMTGDFITLEKVVEHFSEIDVGGPNSETALMVAAGLGHTELAVDLLRLGAKLDAKDQGGKTALDHALNAEEGRVDASLLAILGGDWTALAPSERNTAEMACEALGGSVKAGVEVAGENLRIALYYPRIIETYLSHLRPEYSLPGGELESDVAVFLDTDTDRSTGASSATTGHESAKGAEWVIEFSEVWDGTRYNRQHTPATRELWASPLVPGEDWPPDEISSLELDTEMELNRAVFELPIEAIGVSAGSKLRVVLVPKSCPASSKTLEIGT